MYLSFSLMSSLVSMNYTFTYAVMGIKKEHNEKIPILQI